VSRLGASIVVAVALIACQGSLVGGGPKGTQTLIPNDTGIGERATFVVATPAGLLGLDAKGQPLGRIVSLPSGAMPSGAAVGPDGKTIFFALSETKPGAGFGSEIYSVNIDGSNLRAVLTRNEPNVFYASPSPDATGNLYVHRRVASEDANNPGVYLQSVDTIERLELRTGERQKVLNDGAEPVVIPGGKAIVFVHLDRGQQAGLWTAAIDGTRSEPLLRTGDRFWWLQSPRVSPTGREVTWSSAGRSNPSSTVPMTLARAGTGPKLAHLEIPSELYVAPLDGSQVRSIAVTRDDVAPAWSPDGTRIAFIALSTFYIVSANNGEVIVHTEGIGFNYGDLTWIR